MNVVNTVFNEHFSDKLSDKVTCLFSLVEKNPTLQQDNNTILTMQNEKTPILIGKISD